MIEIVVDSEFKQLTNNVNVLNNFNIKCSRCSSSDLVFEIKIDSGLEVVLRCPHCKLEVKSVYDDGGFKEMMKDKYSVGFEEGKEEVLDEIKNAIEEKLTDLSNEFRDKMLILTKETINNI